MIAKLVSIPRTITRFMREVWSELDKVLWPSKAEVTAFSIVVIGAVGVVALYLGVLDILFAEIANKLRLFK